MQGETLLSVHADQCIQQYRLWDRTCYDNASKFQYKRISDGPVNGDAAPDASSGNLLC